VQWWKFLPDEFLKHLVKTYMSFKDFASMATLKNIYISTEELLRIFLMRWSRRFFTKRKQEKISDSQPTIWWDAIATKTVVLNQYLSAILDPPSSLLKHYYSKAECGKSVWKLKAFSLLIQSTHYAIKKLLKSFLMLEKPKKL